ncbi:MAG: type II toxin-antitoxin system HicB family antitoxin [Bacteroidetes bacterium]|nr:type II toxin-antitoxin system HicB family antitoxin [Bacteroidota bacterium]MBU1422479.1 type II toxin-antitoxin system HicB family antitoxin [Bacteroidota bacterium]MBU2636209.1 type II toxin-antitoxin system HicB family antitoxin [Bacteroidota bacterium]
MKKLIELLKYDYPIRITRYPDGMYCAEIEMIDGLCAYGKTSGEALSNLNEVKEAAFELMLSQGKEPPVPVVKLEIPLNVFKKIQNKSKLRQFVKA